MPNFGVYGFRGFMVVTTSVLKMVVRGMLLGLGAALPIGPVNVEIARRTIRHGFSAGWALGCGAVSIDVIYAMIGGVTVSPLLTNHRLLTALGLLGGTLLAYLAIVSLRAAMYPGRIDGGESGTPTRTRGHYLTGLAMTSLNPMTLLFWFVAVPGAVGKLTNDPRHDLPLVATGVFAGTFVWVCTFVGLMTLASRGASRSGKQAWVRAADLAGGVLLLGFAALTIWRVAGGFLS